MGCEQAPQVIVRWLPPNNVEDPEGAETNGGTRPGAGRPWGSLKGNSAEANAIAGTLRGWIQNASLTVTELRNRLVPEHFSNQRVPAKATLSQWLAGQGLKWDFVEAVAEVCFPEGDVAALRLRELRPIWDRQFVASAPGGTDPSGHESIVHAQRQTIELQDQLLSAREALANSLQAEATARQLIMVLLQMISQLHLQIGELQRQTDMHRSASPGASEDEPDDRLTRSQAHLEQAEREKERAEANQRRAFQLIDQANREINRLKAELARAHAMPQEPDDSSVAGDGPTLAKPDGTEGFLDDVDTALMKVAQVNDAGDRLTLDAQTTLGLAPNNALTSANAPDNHRIGADNQNNDTEKPDDHTHAAGRPPLPVISRLAMVCQELENAGASERTIARLLAASVRSLSRRAAAELVVVQRRQGRYAAASAILGSLAMTCTAEALLSTLDYLTDADAYLAHPLQHRHEALRTPSRPRSTKSSAGQDRLGLLLLAGHWAQPAIVTELLHRLETLRQPAYARILTGAAATRQPAEIMALLRRLRSENMEDATSAFLQHAAKVMSVQSICVLMRSLATAAFDLDAQLLMATALRRPTREVAKFLVYLEMADPEVARIASRAAFGQSRANSAELQAHIHYFEERRSVFQPAARSAAQQEPPILLASAYADGPVLESPASDAVPVAQDPYGPVPPYGAPSAMASSTTRVRINIPGARPIPPVVIRSGADDQTRLPLPIRAPRSSGQGSELPVPHRGPGIGPTHTPSELAVMQPSEIARLASELYTAGNIEQGHVLLQRAAIVCTLSVIGEAIAILQASGHDPAKAFNALPYVQSGPLLKAADEARRRLQQGKSARSTGLWSKLLPGSRDPKA
ncbi:hypothetical protein ACIRST_41200 [Kitasatospora sp. NPDC101447]|uniref:hypothetical protein n=1 Tax=Kitasatospora sp. NPDC101447 TaxID=3364102 RepID=UPI0037F3F8AB